MSPLVRVPLRSRPVTAARVFAPASPRTRPRLMWLWWRPRPSAIRPGGPAWHVVVGIIARVILTCDNINNRTRCQRRRRKHRRHRRYRRLLVQNSECRDNCRADISSPEIHFTSFKKVN